MSLFNKEHPICKYLSLNTDLILVEKIFNNLLKKNKNFFKDKEFILPLEMTSENYARDKYIIELTRKICNKLGLQIKEIVVTFAYANGNAGLVSFVNNDCFIEINSYFKDNVFAISTILAHELTHVWMDRHSLKLPNEEDNEKATDITAFFLGLGIIFLNGIKEKSDIVKNVEVLTEHRYYIKHYIHETTMGYAFVLFLKQKNKTIQDISKYIRTQFAIDVIHNGNFKYKERKKILNKYIKIDKFVVYCPNCFSKIRIDAVKSAKVKCPVCEYIYDFDINK